MPTTARFAPLAAPTSLRQFRVTFRVGRRAAQTWDQFHTEFDAERFTWLTASAYLVNPADVAILDVTEVPMSEPTVTLPVAERDAMLRELRQTRALVTYGNELGRKMAAIHCRAVEGALTIDEPLCSYCGMPIPEGYTICEPCGAEQ